jgi:hypothetical protein
MTRRVRRVVHMVLACGVVYVVSYLALRMTHVEVWSHDGHPYVIIPPPARLLYYVFRPMMHVDGAVTGMRFHIGPHRSRENAADK